MVRICPSTPARDSRTCSKRSQEEIADLLVALRKLSGDFVQQPAGPVFRERHDPGDDPGHPLGTTRTEGPQENAGLVGIEDCGWYV